MRKLQIATVVLFCGLLFSIAAGYLLLPKADFSEMEKRYLAEAPKLTLSNVTSGKFGSEMEDYMSDRVPGRNLFVGINAYLELLAGRQETKDVWLKQGRLLEAPTPMETAAITRNMTAINRFADSIGQRVDLMIVPSAGWAAGVEDYIDDAIIAAVYAEAGEHVAPISVETVFSGKPQLYYSTDHHWTSEGAYAGYAAYMTALGREAKAADSFTVESAGDFHGSTYSRSALWLTPGETIELWHGSENLTVTNGETEDVHEGIFYRERLEEADKYTVYLDGNHSIVRVKNPEKTGKLLVIRDSYSNCLGGFLAESYGEVVLVDLRYYRQALSQMVAEEAFDNILVCYSCHNFIYDTNRPMLR